MILNTYQKTAYRGEEKHEINKIHILYNTIEQYGILSNYIELCRIIYVLLHTIITIETIYIEYYRLTLGGKD